MTEGAGELLGRARSLFRIRRDSEQRWSIKPEQPRDHLDQVLVRAIRDTRTQMQSDVKYPPLLREQQAKEKQMLEANRKALATGDPLDPCIAEYVVEDRNSALAMVEKYRQENAAALAEQTASNNGVLPTLLEVPVSDQKIQEYRKEAADLEQVLRIFFPEQIEPLPDNIRSLHRKSA